MQVITAQLLMVLNFAHIHNIIHTDIKLQNIFVKIQNKELIKELLLATEQQRKVPSVRDVDKNKGACSDGGEEEAKDLLLDQTKPKPKSEAQEILHQLQTAQQPLDLKDVVSKILADSKSDSSSTSKVADNLESENILVKQADTQEKSSSPGDPKILKYTIIRSTSLKRLHSGSTDDLLFTEIALGDWGAASWKDKHLTKIIQPVALRAPEVLIGVPWDFTTDLWNLGAVIFEIFRNVQLFRGIRYPSRLYELKQHLNEIVNEFGEFPISLLKQGDKEIVEKHLKSDGTVKNVELIFRAPLESTEHPFWEGVEWENVVLFMHFLRAMMAVDPRERKSVGELPEEPWIAHLFV